MLKKFVLIPIVTLHFLNLSALVISYISVYVSPLDNQIIPFFGLLFPFFFIIASISTFMLFFLNRKIAFFSIIVLLSGSYYVSKYFNFNFEKDEKPDLSILSYNVRLFDKFYWDVNKSTHKEIIDFIAIKNADIVCLQEFHSMRKSKFSAFDTIMKLPKSKNFYISRIVESHTLHHAGLAVFTKFPIIKSEILVSGKLREVCIFCDLKIGSDTIRLYNIHLESIMLRAEEISINKDLEKQKINVRRSYRKMQFAYEKRAEQVTVISKHIALSPYKVIVCGDFNDNPVSYAYRIVNQNLNDAFCSAGTGFAFTYADGIPFLRIDYILHQNEIQIIDFQIIKIYHSDHFPLWCEISLKAK